MTTKTAILAISVACLVSQGAPQVWAGEAPDPAVGSAAAPVKLLTWEEARALAKQHPRPIFAHFSASWCKPCAALKRHVYTQPDVRKRMKRFLVAEVQTESEPGQTEWMQLKEDGLPVLAFYDTSGEEVKSLRIRGVKTAQELAVLLDAAWAALGKGAKESLSPAEERRRAAAGEAAGDGAQAPANNRATRKKIRGGEWQTSDTGWLMTAVMVMVGVLFGLTLLFVVLKMRRTRRLNQG